MGWDNLLPQRRTLYISTHGLPPWDCPRCDNPILEDDDYVIHHIDENHSNDEITNLIALHWGCHTSLHRTGNSLPDAQRKKISNTMKERGIAPTMETRRLGGAAAATSELRLQRVREALTGQPLSSEHRRTISETRLKTKKIACPHCGRMCQPGPLGMHIKHKHSE